MDHQKEVTAGEMEMEMVRSAQNEMTSALGEVSPVTEGINMRHLQATPGHGTGRLRKKFASGKNRPDGNSGSGRQCSMNRSTLAQLG